MTLKQIIMSQTLREIEMRDLVSVCVVMFGFSPYLTDQLNSDDIYAIGGVA